MAQIQLDKCVCQALGTVEFANQVSWKTFHDFSVALHAEALVTKLAMIDRRRDALQSQEVAIRASLVALSSERTEVINQHRTA